MRVLFSRAILRQPWWQHPTCQARFQGQRQRKRARAMEEGEEDGLQLQGCGGVGKRPP